MIQRQHALPQSARACDCTKPPRYIVSRGNRLTTWHFECSACGHCTAPATSESAAMRRWAQRELFPLDQIRSLRPQPPQLSARKPAPPALVTRLQRAG